jgi:hypothetical protein
MLIVRSRATPKLLAKQACANVRGADTIIGVVLNQLEIGDSEYSYSYSYSYSDSYYGYPQKGGSLEREEERVSQG